MIQRSRFARLWLLALVGFAPVAATAMLTPWSNKVDANAPLPEYPRPQLQRDTWINLNGSWDYAVRARDLLAAPTAFDGKILVPFPIALVWQRATLGVVGRLLCAMAGGLGVWLAVIFGIVRPRFRD